MKSLDELKKIRERAKENLRLRESTDTAQIQVSMGTCGIAAGARDVMMALMDELGQTAAYRRCGYPDGLRGIV